MSVEGVFEAIPDLRDTENPVGLTHGTASRGEVEHTEGKVDIERIKSAALGIPQDAYTWFRATWIDRFRYPAGGKDCSRAREALDLAVNPKREVSAQYFEKPAVPTVESSKWEPSLRPNAVVLDLFRRAKENPASLRAPQVADG